MRQIAAARKGIVTEEMDLCAKREGVSPEHIRRGVADGTVVVVRNNTRRTVEPLAIGKGLKTKINANIGTSPDRVDLALELEKVRICTAAGADAIMDLSTGGDIRAIRREILAASRPVIGTVPIYQAATRMLAGGRAIVDMGADDLFQVI